ncbi:hypothetical protein DFH08DRAFT_820610 [Mycena albidolilacea]|uniref:Uncharacterized protein n=1 Tax=Mycena albidolilacea TaxID=1033008 RepID=A0AAD6ZCC2_9AGAR|nr:hypothetical protein DFH08DRAFT_820610 [Mycena albidolilacea]
MSSDGPPTFLVDHSSIHHCYGGRLVLYSSVREVRDYFSWRQTDSSGPTGRREYNPSSRHSEEGSTPIQEAVSRPALLSYREPISGVIQISEDPSLSDNEGIRIEVLAPRPTKPCRPHAGQDKTTHTNCRPASDIIKDDFWDTRHAAMNGTLHRRPTTRELGWGNVLEPRHDSKWHLAVCRRKKRPMITMDCHMCALVVLLIDEGPTLEVITLSPKVVTKFQAGSKSRVFPDVWRGEKSEKCKLQLAEFPDHAVARWTENSGDFRMYASSGYFNLRKYSRRNQPSSTGIEPNFPTTPCKSATYRLCFRDCPFQSTLSISPQYAQSADTVRVGYGSYPAVPFRAGVLKHPLTFYRAAAICGLVVEILPEHSFTLRIYPKHVRLIRHGSRYILYTDTVWKLDHANTSAASQQGTINSNLPTSQPVPSVRLRTDCLPSVLPGSFVQPANPARLCRALGARSQRPRARLAQGCQFWRRESPYSGSTSNRDICEHRFICRCWVSEYQYLWVTNPAAATTIFLNAGKEWGMQVSWKVVQMIDAFQGSKKPNLESERNGKLGSQVDPSRDQGSKILFLPPTARWSGLLKRSMAGHGAKRQLQSLLTPAWISAGIGAPRILNANRSWSQDAPRRRDVGPPLVAEE